MGFQMGTAMLGIPARSYEASDLWASSLPTFLPLPFHLFLLSEKDATRVPQADTLCMKAPRPRAKVSRVAAASACMAAGVTTLAKAKEKRNGDMMQPNRLRHSWRMAVLLSRGRYDDSPT